MLEHVFPQETILWMHVCVTLLSVGSFNTLKSKHGPFFFSYGDSLWLQLVVLQQGSRNNPISSEQKMAYLEANDSELHLETLLIVSQSTLK